VREQEPDRHYRRSTEEAENAPEKQTGKENPREEQGASLAEAALNDVQREPSSKKWRNE
jgi:hypothetical protein